MVLGIAFNLIRDGGQNTQIMIVILLTSMTVSGIKTAENFSFVRHKESSEIALCIEKYSLYAPKCKKLLYPGEKIMDQKEFTDAITYLDRVN
jgi:hypothetical protein